LPIVLENKLPLHVGLEPYSDKFLDSLTKTKSRFLFSGFFIESV